MTAASLPRPALGDRSLFPRLQARAYLNHAAISPVSLLVEEAVGRVTADYAARGAGAFRAWMEQRERLRGSAAALLGAASGDVVLTAGTTRSVIALAWSIPWRRGDRIVLFRGEFPANVTPWQQVARELDLVISWLDLDGFADGSGDGLARLEDELRRGVRLVAVSAVQFQTGLRMPLAQLGALCRQHGAELFTDAIQACGAVPLDARDADYLVTGAHKWLMGLEGCGFAYVAPERARVLVPRMAGWLSHEDGLGFLFDGPGHLRYDRPVRQRADMLESGAFNTVGLAALEASVDALRGLGVGAIHAHANAWLDRIEPLLLARGFTSRRAADPAARSCILSLLPPEGVAVTALLPLLAARGIACTIPDGHLRISPHWPNSPDEVPLVVDAIDEALAALRAGG